MTITKKVKDQIRRARKESLRNAKCQQGHKGDLASWYYGHAYGLDLALKILKGVRISKGKGSVNG